MRPSGPSMKIGTLILSDWRAYLDTLGGREIKKSQKNLKKFKKTLDFLNKIYYIIYRDERKK